MVPLKEIAEVRRGFTTGANEFFYLTEEEIKRRGIEKEFWMHKDNEGNLVPNYLAESPSDIISYKVDRDRLKKRVILVHLSKEELKNKKVANYIKYGEKKGYNKRDTCEQNAKRKNGRWYDLDEISANLLWPEYSRERLVTFYSELPLFINNRLYAIYTKNPVLLCGILNSTIIHLFAELTGPQPGGGGGPKGIRVYDLKAMPIPFRDLKKYKKAIDNSTKEILDRNVESIFSEIGAVQACDVLIENIKKDRRNLDKIIMGEILGLTEEEQLEVYRAVIDLVKSRIDKARSFEGSQKTADGIDIQALSESIVKTIKKEP